jgi:hypothetical protein
VSDEGFRIASAYVEIHSNTGGLAEEIRTKLRAAVDEGTADIGNVVGANLGAGVQQSLDGFVQETLPGLGDDIGQTLGDEMGRGVREGLEAATEDAVPAVGDEIGRSLGDGIDKGIEDAKPKIQDSGRKAGQAAGEGASEGLSPLIVTAIAGAAALGAPLLLAGLGTAFVGITALALKNNKVIADDYSELGKTAKAAIQEATAPLAGDMHQALQTVDGDVKALQPDLNSLFAQVGPDIDSVAAGIDNFVSGVLPGLATALGGSHQIVSDFASGLGSLGSGVGSFFANLTRDSSTTGAALQSVMGLLGNTLSTVGSIVGSASAAIGTDLLALDPILSGLMTTIRNLANPATVGALAGLFGAMKFGDSIGSGLDSVAGKLKNFAGAQKDAEGLMGGLGSAAEGASGMLGKMAGVVSGPWGLAIGAGVGLASGLIGSLINMSHATDAVTLSTQGLQQAVQADSGAFGENTAAFIAQQDAANGLADTAKSAGVSIETLTAAIGGNGQAQAALTAAISKANQAQVNNKLATDSAAKANSHAGQDLQGATVAADGARAANNTLTDANLKLENSVKAQIQQVSQAITKQQQMTAATTALNNTTQVFNATLKADYTQMVANATQSSTNTVAALNLGTQYTDLNQTLQEQVSRYQQTQQQGNAYAAVVQSLNNTTQNSLSTQANFTLSLGNISSQAQSAGTSLDIANQKGAQNILVFTQAAQAADASAEALYNSESSTKGASTAYNDANNKLATQKQAFIDAADKAGYNKGQVQQLANQLFQLPKTASTAIDANTNPAKNKLNSLINEIDNSSGTVTIYTKTSPTNLKGYARGGQPPLNEPVIVGEEGPEVVMFGSQATVVPNDQLPRLEPSGEMLAGQGGVAGAASGPTYAVNFGDINIQGIVDLTNPRGMTTAAKQMVWQLRNAIKVVEQQYGVSVG